MDLNDDNLILFPSSKNHLEVDFSLLKVAEHLSSDRPLEGPNNDISDFVRSEDNNEKQILPALFRGDFPQLDFEIDLLSFEELAEMLLKQYSLLEEQYARLTFYLDELKDSLDL